MPEDIAAQNNRKKPPNSSNNDNALHINKNGEYITRARELSVRNGIIKEELKTLVDSLFIGNTNNINRSLFKKNKFLPNHGASELTPHTAKFITNISQLISEKYRAEGSALEADINRSITEAIRTARDTAIESGESPQGLSFFVFDTETNRLFGDVISVGWIKVDSDDDGFSVESKNLILPPKFISYGSERIHGLSIDFIKDQHSLGRTTSEVETALMWLKNALSSKAVIGFNVSYDLNGMKRLFHCHSGIESSKIERLFEKISENYAADAQDILLRIDPTTRVELNLPMSPTMESRTIASSVFEDTSNNGHPIEYLPNKKLISYAQYFLGMRVENAHGALYDCVLTLPLFLFAAGLRHKVLANEGQLKLNSNLTDYKRSIRTSNILSCKLFTKLKSKPVDVQIFAHPFLKLNPSIKPSPFISRPLGIAVHRRHIIPKSAIFSLVTIGHDRIKKQNLYKDVVSSELFFKVAKNILSKNALKVCEVFSNLPEFLDEYSDRDLVKSVSSLLKNYENTLGKGLKLRYFDSDEASNIIQSLPKSSAIVSNGTVGHDDMINTMNIIMYSLFHTLDSNHFIGPGCDNILAGKMFHFLERIEPAALTEFDQLETEADLSNSLKNFLQKVVKFLLSSPSSNDSIFSGLDFEEVFDLNAGGKVEADKALLFLEMHKSINSFLQAFADFNFDVAGRKSKICSSFESRNNFISSLGIFIKQEGNLRESCKTEIMEPQVSSDLKAIHLFLTDSVGADAINAGVESALDLIGRITQDINNSNLFGKDKVLLNAFIQNYFYDCSVKPEITAVSDSKIGAVTPGILSFEKNNNDPVADTRKSFKSFVKSLKDSTWYDLPQSGISPIQNSHLIPIATKALDLTSTQDVSIAETSEVLNQLLTFDDGISTALDVDRTHNPKLPLYSDFVQHLY